MYMPDDIFYFLAFPGGDRTQITVIDLARAVSYERDEWANVNSDTYCTPEEAVAAARDIALRHGLTYQLFESRYNSCTSEQLEELR